MIEEDMAKKSSQGQFHGIITEFNWNEGVKL
jgi:hypothetical protein